MGDRFKLGGGVIGLIFLALGVVKLVQGKDWIVWIVLGALFGGLAALGNLFNGRGDS